MRKASVVFWLLLLALRPSVVSAVDLSYPADYPPATLGTDMFGTNNSLFPGVGVNLSGNRVTVTATPGNLLTGNVFGGMANGVADVSDNTVLISGGTIGSNLTLTGPWSDRTTQADQDLGAVGANLPLAGGVFGGVALGSAFRNTVTIAGGEIKGGVTGGLTGTALAGPAADNQVIITGGIVNFEINGGISYFGNVTGNSVSISGGIIRDWVYGASVIAGNGNAVSNSVTITGGRFEGSGIRRVYGAIAMDGDSINNTLTVSNLADPAALANRALYGGSSIAGNASGNTLLITGTPGFQAAALSGGYGGPRSVGKQAINNTVSIIDSDNFAIRYWIRGGRLDDGAGNDGMNDGNTLNLIRSGGRAESIAFFETYNLLLPKSLTTAAPLVEITGLDSVDMTGVNLNILGIQSGGKPFRPGDTVTLLSKADNLAAFDATVSTGLISYDFRVFTDGALKMTLASAAPEPPANILPVGPAAAVAVLGQGGDLIADLAFPTLEPAERRKKPTAFAVVSGSDMRYDIGSRLDVRGVSALAGFDWCLPVFDGTLNLAVFFETGRDNYDSRQSFGGFSSLTADGDVEYYGGGVLARLDLPVGWHAEASLRTGAASIDFKTRDIRDASGNRADYDYNAPYYGAHAGTGYTWSINEESAIDFYAKYLWLRLESDRVSVLDQRVSLEAQDSQRLRAGGRYTYTASPQFSLYGGAGWEYEFSAKAKGSVYGYDLESPSLKGGSGLGEAGIAYENGGLSLELGARGYAGSREGITGRFMVGYSF